jgi:hypothetical protein
VTSDRNPELTVEPGSNTWTIRLGDVPFEVRPISGVIPKGSMDVMIDQRKGGHFRFDSLTRFTAHGISTSHPSTHAWYPNAQFGIEWHIASQ